MSDGLMHYAVPMDLHLQSNEAHALPGMDLYLANMVMHHLV